VQHISATVFKIINTHGLLTSKNNVHVLWGKYSYPPLSSENLWWLRLGIQQTFLYFM